MTNTENMQAVLEIAANLHAGQKRKFDGSPYIEHPKRVLKYYNKIQKDRDRGISYSDRAICLLHDTVEDCDITPMGLANLLEQKTVEQHAFSIGVIVQGVSHLTNYYTHEKFPNLNKLERSRLEALRLAEIHPDYQEIKVCDMIDNLMDFAVHDFEYYKKYRDMKQFCVSLMNLKDDVQKLFNSVITACDFFDGINHENSLA